MYQPSSHQRAVDQVQAAAKAVRSGRPSLFKPPPPTPAPSRSPLDLRLAEELDFIRRRLDLIGGFLTEDPALLRRHATSLQDIDLINQTLGHLGKVIGAEDKDAAAERISLAELKGRLLRKPIASILSSQA
jgi:hypothetical protein